MPSTTPERRARWPGHDKQAIDYLRSCGYVLNRGWSWAKPSAEHEPTDREIDAVVYLIEEWDFLSERLGWTREFFK